MNFAAITVAAANSGTPWLTIAGAIPLVGAIVVALLPVRLAKMTALAFAVADLIWVIVMATQFSTSGPTYQLTEQYSWIPQFGVHYALGVDGIALVLIGMTAVLMPVVILASWHDADGTGIQRSPKTYFALMLALDTMMIGVFAATDVFLFYVFFEAMLVPMYFMIGSFGVGPRQYAAVKFLLYSLLGGLLMLVAVIALYVYSSESASTGHHGTFMFYSLVHLALSSDGAEVAVPRLLRRVRDQGAAVAVPHLAARRRVVRAAGRRGADARRDGQGRHLRHDQVLP